MAYPQKGNLLNFFMPNIPVATTTSGVLREMDIGAASGNHGEYVCVRPCRMKLAGFLVTGEVVAGTTTAPTVIFTHRPTPLSATGEVVASTLTIPDTTAVGAAIIDSDLDVEFSVGDSVEISWTVGVGDPTGMGHAFAEFDYQPENEAANNTEVTETA
jgi:hypothetical protein